MKVAEVDLSTETASNQQHWNCSWRRCQWVRCSAAGGCGEGGGGGSADRGGGKAAAADLSTHTWAVGAVELLGVANVAAVDLSTDTA